MNRYKTAKTSMAYIINRNKIDGIVLKDTKKKKGIIYGRRALNKQVPGFVRAETRDYDIYINQPKKQAHYMQKKLDKEVAGGYDLFYAKPAIHPGTHKVMHKGGDLRKGTDDDFEVIDYTNKPRKITTIKRNGIYYESIGSIKRGKKKILQDPKSAYRHEKDKADLARIRSRWLFAKK